MEPPQQGIHAPSNLEAEQAILSICLQNNSTFERVRPEQFYSTSHRLVAESIQSLREKNTLVDAISVRNELVETGRLEKAGGEVQLGELLTGAGLPTQLDYYEGLVIDAYNKRKVLLGVMHIASSVNHNGMNSTQAIGLVQELTDDLLQLQDGIRGYQTKTVQKLIEKGMDKVPYLVEQVIPEREIMLFAADGGTGKSYCGLELARCVAMGTPFLGRFEINRPGKVLILDYENGEDRNSVRCRQMQIPPELAITFVDKDDILGTYIDDPAGFHKLLSIVRTERPVLTIIDSATPSMSGDENEARDTRKYFTNLERIAKRGDTSICLIHHNRKGGKGKDESQDQDKIRGSVDWRNAPSVSFGLKKIGDGWCAYIQLKARDYADIKPINLKIGPDKETGRFSVTVGPGPDKADREQSTIIRTVIASTIIVENGRLQQNEVCNQVMQKLADDEPPINVKLGTIRKHINEMEKAKYIEKRHGSKSPLLVLTDHGKQHFFPGHNVPDSSEQDEIPF
jgi:hypothetical protein